MKFPIYTLKMFSQNVTPFAGVWIEILSIGLPRTDSTVTPFAGVWIEIAVNLQRFPAAAVTPFAGVWIEICHSESG